jgi:hypothetical protein
MQRAALVAQIVRDRTAALLLDEFAASYLVVLETRLFLVSGVRRE